MIPMRDVKTLSDRIDGLENRLTFQDVTMKTLNKTITPQWQKSDSPSRSQSWFDGAGCAALTGSDAGKLSIRPASSFAWVSRSAKAASRGSAACLSCGAGLNFSAMLSLHRQYNALAIQTFPTSELERH